MGRLCMSAIRLPSFLPPSLLPSFPPSPLPSLLLSFLPPSSDTACARKLKRRVQTQAASWKRGNRAGSALLFESCSVLGEIIADVRFLLLCEVSIHLKIVLQSTSFFWKAPRGREGTRVILVILPGPVELIRLLSSPPVRWH